MQEVLESRDDSKTQELSESTDIFSHICGWECNCREHLCAGGLGHYLAPNTGLLVTADR